MTSSRASRQNNCQWCKEPFDRQKETGRRPKYCSPRCRSAAFRERKAGSSDTSFGQDAGRIGQSLAARARMVAQTTAVPVPAWPLEPLRHGAALQRDLDDFIAVAVREARERGAGWSEIAAVTSISVSTLKSRYSHTQVTRAVSARRRRSPAPQRATRPAQVVVPGAPAPEEPADDNEALQRNAHHALARALSHLHRSSGLSIRTIAARAGISASYAYRLMAGERNATWETVRNFATACDHDPNDLVDLWNAAAGVRGKDQTADNYTMALARFRGALRGLHLAGAQCDPQVIISNLNIDAHAAQIIVSLLSAPVTRHAEKLSWPATAALTAALHGDENRMHRHWQALQKVAPHPAIEAQAFG